MNHQKVLVVCLVIFTAVVPMDMSAQFLPPGALNPAAASDTGADFFIDHFIDAEGVTHAVWASQHDYDGSSGSDPDIWYAFNAGSGWSSPRLVNSSYGHLDSPSFDDREPRIAGTPDGVLYCVWSTNLNGYGWGADYDILISVQTTPGGFWSAPLPINDATTDTADDRYPAIAVPASGEPVVLWEGEDTDLPFDREILWSYQSDLGWTSPEIMNQGQFSDWDDHGPISLGATRDRETLIAAWAADNSFESDIFLSEYHLSDFLPPVWSPPLDMDQIPQPWPAGYATAPAIALHQGETLSIHVAYSGIRDGSADTDIWYRVLIGDLDDEELRGFWKVNSDADFDDLEDLNPDICVEPSGSIHVVWQRVDPGQDDDVYYAASSRPIASYPIFSPAITIGGQGAADDPGEHDLTPDLECFGEGLLSAAWNSLDDLGGPLGGDWDILHSLGLGRLFTPPESPHPSWALDDGPGDDDLDPVLASRSDGSVLFVWPSLFATGNTGPDQDLVWSALDPTGTWVANGYPMVGATTDSGLDLDPVLATAPSGLVYSVFATDTDLGGTLGTDIDLVYAVHGGIGWSGPFPVGSWGSQDDPAGSTHDLGPAAVVTHDGTLIVAWAAPGVGIVTLRKTASGWQPPEIVGPTSAYSDADLASAVTLALDTMGLPMVAFKALDPVTLEGRLYWSRREANSWLPVVEIGPAIPDHPPVLVMAGEEPMIIWASEADIGGAGPDVDLLTARLGFQGWSSPESLFLAHLFDVDTDYDPVGVVAGRSLHLAWVSDANVGGTAGQDLDILYAEIDLEQFPPYLPVVVLANPSGHADSTTPQSGPAIAMGRGRVVVAWSRGSESDWDVFTSQLATPETPLFGDGFETGDTSRWTAGFND